MQDKKLGMGRDGMDGRDGIGREGLKIKKSQSSKVLKPHNGNTWFGLFKGGFTLGMAVLQKNSKKFKKIQKSLKVHKSQKHTTDGMDFFSVQLKNASIRCTAQNEIQLNKILKILENQKSQV